MKNIISLKHKTSITIFPKPPYSFDTTIHKPSHFPSSDNELAKGKYWITMLWRGKTLGLNLENNGTNAKPKIRISVYSEKPLNEDFFGSVITEIKHRFNTKSDISGFFKKFRKDKILGPLIKKWGAMKPVAANSLYETLVIYVALQNATVRRTSQMLENLFKKLGRKVRFGGKILSTFWKPQEMAKISEDNLRKLKLGSREVS